MSVEKMMEEFKVWAAKASFPLDLRDDGHFLYMDTRNAWHGWRGRHESLEVELPKPAQPIQAWNDDAQRIENGRRSGYKQALRDCKDEIEAMGLKVKK